MKKLITIALTVVSFSVTFSQTNTKLNFKFALGSELPFQKTSSYQFPLIINIGGGIELHKNLFVDAEIQTAPKWIDKDNFYTEFGIGPQYFINVQENLDFSLFVKYYLGLSKWHNEQSIGTTHYIAPGIGFNYTISNNLKLFATGQFFQEFASSYNTNTKYNSIMCFVGFRYFF